MPFFNNQIKKVNKLAKDFISYLIYLSKIIIITSLFFIIINHLVIDLERPRIYSIYLFRLNLTKCCQ